MHLQGRIRRQNRKYLCMKKGELLKSTHIDHGHFNYVDIYWNTSDKQKHVLKALEAAAIWNFLLSQPKASSNSKLNSRLSVRWHKKLSKTAPDEWTRWLEELEAAATKQANWVCYPTALAAPKFSAVFRNLLAIGAHRWPISQDGTICGKN